MKLANMGSTQVNESFNMTIASKASKRCYCIGSASMGYRVAAVMAQKKQHSAFLCGTGNRQSALGKLSVKLIFVKTLPSLHVNFSHYVNLTYNM